MDYLGARWFLVKDLSAEKLQTFHALENAAFGYAAFARKNFRRDNAVPPLWWAAACDFLWAQNGFYKRCAGAAYVREIDLFAAEVKKVLYGRGVAPEKLFGDVELMHGCDKLVRKLHFTNHLTSLSSKSSLPSSQTRALA